MLELQQQLFAIVICCLTHIYQTQAETKHRYEQKEKIPSLQKTDW